MMIHAEERVREIAREEISKALVSWPMHDAMSPQEIRDATLEEAAMLFAGTGLPILTEEARKALEKT